MRTFAGSAELACDRSFSVPVLAGCGAHLVVLATQDTIPVLLGLCLGGESRGGAAAVSPATESDPADVIGSPETLIRLSPASTALALTMTNPLISGATGIERLKFASEVVDHQDFEGLVADVKDGLGSKPATYLDGVTMPGLYTDASRIARDVLGGSIGGGRCAGEVDGSGLEPYVEDAPGDDIALANGAFINYGACIVDAVADTLKDVMFLEKRSASLFGGPQSPHVLTYDLGEACANISFFKGIAGVDDGWPVDPQYPWGLATLTNVSQAVWNVLSVFEDLPAREGPDTSVIWRRDTIRGFAGAIGDGGPGDVMLEAIACVSCCPEEVVEGLLGNAVPPSEFDRFFAAAGPVLENAVGTLVSGGLAGDDRFAYGLVASPDFVTRCVCQADGEIFDCPGQPVLSAGVVAPDSGGISTDFSFIVHYYHRLGVPPSFVRAVIDWEEREMRLLSGAPDDGVYAYTTTLTPGLHAYYFVCYDTTGAAARFPAAGRVEGPFVAVAPVFTGGRVQPGRGSTTTRFIYKADFYDVDGQVPTSVLVFIDGDPHDMGHYYSWGDSHRYTLATTLPGGTHDYFFQVEDPSGHVVRLPEEGVYLGPSVSQYLPELSNPSVSPPEGAWGDTYTYEVDYYDQDGDAPYFVSVCHDGILQNMALKTGSPSDGTYSRGIVHTVSGQHDYYFMCADSTLALVRLPEAGTFTGPYVDERPGGQRNWNAKMAVHVIAYNPHMDCGERLPEINGCWDIQYEYGGSNVMAFPVFFDLVEYQGVEFGLTWPEWEGGAAWQTCADLSIGDISEPGDGVSLVWHDCHLENTVVPGWIWLYADGPGLIAPCGHPFTGTIQILNCREAIDIPWMWAGAGVNGAEGHDPCFTPVSLDESQRKGR